MSSAKVRIEIGIETDATKRRIATVTATGIETATETAIGETSDAQIGTGPETETTARRGELGTRRLRDEEPEEKTSRLSHSLATNGERTRKGGR
jgi:hypothetical protein